MMTNPMQMYFDLFIESYDSRRTVSEISNLKIMIFDELFYHRRNPYSVRVRLVARGVIFGGAVLYLDEG